MVKSIIRIMEFGNAITFKIYASRTEKLTKTRVQFLLTPSVLSLALCHLWLMLLHTIMFRMFSQIPTIKLVLCVCKVVSLGRYIRSKELSLLLILIVMVCVWGVIFDIILFIDDNNAMKISSSGTTEWRDRDSPPSAISVLTAWRHHCRYPSVFWSYSWL